MHTTSSPVDRHRVAVFGAGRWGRHYLRLLPQLGADVPVCCTRRVEPARSWLAEHHPGVLHTVDGRAALAAGVDAAVVATPRQTHAALALGVLRRGLPALVEKPLALSVEEVRRLRAVAGQHGVALLTGYTHCYDPSFRELCRRARGQPATEWRLRWHSTTPAASPTDLLWEYFPHVLSMALLLAGPGPGDPAEVRLESATQPAAGACAVQARVRVGGCAGQVQVVTGARRRTKQLVLRAGTTVVAEWTDRVLAPGRGGAVRSTVEPLAGQIRAFLQAVPAGPAAANPLSTFDLPIAAMLAGLAADLAARPAAAARTAG